MLELYYFHGATCGLKARLGMAEKGIDYTHRVVERPALRKPEYLKLNRNGVVPTLVHDGEVFTESSVIINYADDAFDGPVLKPDDPRGIARAWWWMKHADECLPNIGIMTYTVSMRPGILQKSPEELDSYIEGIPNPAVRERRRKIIEMGYESPDFPVALNNLKRTVRDMETAMADRDWLAADTYSLADTAMTPILERLHELRFNELWEADCPKVTDWWARIQARKSYDEVLGKSPSPETPLHNQSGEAAWPEVRKLLKA